MLNGSGEYVIGEFRAHKMYRNCINIIILLIYFMPSLAHSEGLQPGNIDFKVSSLPGMERYIDLLQYPSYLAVALLNNKIKFSYSNDLTLLDKHALKISFVTFRFIGKNGQRFIYTAEILKGIDSRFSFRVEIDASEARQGRISLHLYIPLTQIITQAQYDRINLEIQGLSDKKYQKKMLSYFQELEKKQNKNKNIEEGIMEMILMDGLNRKSPEASAKIPSLNYVSILLSLTIIGLVIFCFLRRHK